LFLVQVQVLVPGWFLMLVVVPPWFPALVLVVVRLWFAVQWTAMEWAFVAPSGRWPAGGLGSHR